MLVVFDDRSSSNESDILQASKIRRIPKEVCIKLRLLPQVRYLFRGSRFRICTNQVLCLRN